MNKITAKVIDEKGRLFGKINIIDFLVIVFFVSLTPVFFSFGQKEKKAPEAKIIIVAQEVPPQYTQIRALCELVELTPAALNSVMIGTQQVDEQGKVIGGIIWVGESSPFIEYGNLGIDEDGKLRKIIFGASKFKNLSVKLWLKVQIRGTDLYYNGQILRLGLPFIFKTDKYDIKVLMKNVDNSV
ncbi:MAG: DUF4330 family protein [Candidatus Omnitrophota bacterium]|nr:DUF4330 family protein [Candidatus Omnitrophota bacterium]